VAGGLAEGSGVAGGLAEGSGVAGGLAEGSGVAGGRGAREWPGQWTQIFQP